MYSTSEDLAGLLFVLVYARQEQCINDNDLCVSQGEIRSKQPLINLQIRFCIAYFFFPKPDNFLNKFRFLVSLEAWEDILMMGCWSQCDLFTCVTCSHI